MAKDPAKDLADHLDSNSTAVTAGTNLFYGPIRAVQAGVPVEAVFVIGVGGLLPQRVMGSTTSDVRSASVQVSVRSDSYSNGYSLARTAHNILQSATPSGYMDCMALQSDPAFLEMDKQFRYFWADNFRMIWTSTD